MKEKEKPFPVSSIELDKIYRAMDKRKSLGYSDRGLSFLLGYRPTYIRDVENPLHTLRYTIRDTNYLRCIFDCELSEIMADKIPEPFYQINVEILITDDTVTHKIYRDYMPGNRVLWKEFSTGIEVYPNTSITNTIEVENLVKTLFNSDYFEEPKTALEVFKYCSRTIEYPIVLDSVIQAIGNYTGKRKAPRLIQKKKFGRFVYRKEY